MKKGTSLLAMSKICGLQKGLEEIKRDKNIFVWTLKLITHIEVDSVSLSVYVKEYNLNFK